MKAGAVSMVGFAGRAMGLWLLTGMLLRIALGNSVPINGDTCATTSQACLAGVERALLQEENDHFCGFGGAPPCLWTVPSNGAHGCILHKCAYSMLDGSSCGKEQNLDITCTLSCSVLGLSSSVGFGECAPEQWTSSLHFSAMVSRRLFGDGGVAKRDSGEEVNILPEDDDLSGVSVSIYDAPVSDDVSTQVSEHSSRNPTPNETADPQATPELPELAPPTSATAHATNSMKEEVDGDGDNDGDDDSDGTDGDGLLVAAPKSALVLLVIDDPYQTVDSDDIEDAIEVMLDLEVNAMELTDYVVPDNMTAFAFVALESTGQVKDADDIVSQLLDLSSDYLEATLGARVVALIGLIPDDPANEQPKSSNTNVGLPVGICLGIFMAFVIVIVALKTRHGARRRAEGDTGQEPAFKLRKVEIAGVIMDIGGDVNTDDASEKQFLDDYFLANETVVSVDSNGSHKLAERSPASEGHRMSATEEQSGVCECEGPPRANTVVPPDSGAELLYRACLEGDAEAIRSLLVRGADPCAPFAVHSGSTPLHLAVYSQSIEAVRAVVEAIKNVDGAAGADGATRAELSGISKDDAGDAQSPADSMLSESARSSAGACDIVAVGDDGYGSTGGPSPPSSNLSTAVSPSNHSPAPSETPGGHTPDCEGAREGGMRRLPSEESLRSTEESNAGESSVSEGRDARKRRSVRLDAVDGDHCTALCVAARLGLIDILGHLLTEGASPLIADANGWAPLHWCAAGGNVDAVELLCRYGARKNQRTHKEQTPLFIAAREGQAAVVALLFDAGADRTAPDMEGRTPFSAAVSAENPGAPAVFFGSAGLATQHRPIQPRDTHSQHYRW